MKQNTRLRDRAAFGIRFATAPGPKCGECAVRTNLRAAAPKAWNSVCLSVSALPAPTAQALRCLRAPPPPRRRCRASQPLPHRAGAAVSASPSPTAQALPARSSHTAQDCPSPTAYVERSTAPTKLLELLKLLVSIFTLHLTTEVDSYPEIGTSLNQEVEIFFQIEVCI